MINHKKIYSTNSLTFNFKNIDFHFSFFYHTFHLTHLNNYIFLQSYSYFHNKIQETLSFHSYKENMYRGNLKRVYKYDVFPPKMAILKIYFFLQKISLTLKTEELFSIIVTIPIKITMITNKYKHFNMCIMKQHSSFTAKIALKISQVI